MQDTSRTNSGGGVRPPMAGGGSPVPTGSELPRPPPSTTSGPQADLRLPKKTKKKSRKPHEKAAFTTPVFLSFFE